MDDARRALIVRLEALEGRGPLQARCGDRVMEFHVSRRSRDELGIEGSLFRSTGNVILPDFRAARLLARRINERFDAAIMPERAVRAGRLNAMALIDEILHDVSRLFREKAEGGALARAYAELEAELGAKALEGLLLAFVDRFPPLDVYRGRSSAQAWLAAAAGATGAAGGANRELALEELILLRLANENPAFGPFRFLFDESLLGPPLSPEREAYEKAVEILGASFARMSAFGPDDQDLLTMLRSPAKAAPDSLPGQLDYIRSRWGLILGDRLLRLLGALDLIKEEEKPRFPGPGPTRSYAYSGMEKEYERFSPDADWMPNVVMMAKSALVWLWQLSRSYGRDIRTLDAIPDEELDALASRGFNALWLIGLWERSPASAEIKRRCGNPEAAASAYSLFDYEISGELGGWPALERLRERCSWRGLRLAADMVPNHTGIDSTWVRERPELFIQAPECPFPSYSFNGQDLSGDARVGIWLEDHYYDRTDAAVVFKRLDRSSGAVSYLYHGNDGTGLPWSDTAQIDFLRKEAREAVKERILHVARNFPIIRFDAAMIMAKKHFRRLWYPEPGSGGDISSRGERAMDGASFDAAMPEEFWREVVDLCAAEAPGTLLLAEAFWMMEGYFVRTLGMHRVYNSAFMNMIKKEENAKYRETIRNTQEFDKDILKRFVNFMNNPDEETAVAQFGKGDKYFGACTLMATMPGLPMFGHGQLEGFEEKYGMEYRRAYRDEEPNRALMERHEREIFPLLKRRRLFSGVERFLLYDLVGPGGSVNENVFAYSNGDGAETALVAYNNAYERAEGRLRDSCAFAEKLDGGQKRLTRSSLASALGLRLSCGEARDSSGIAVHGIGGARDAGEARARFCVMREQRSGLWFIRRSREIAEEGLALILDGYQSQVFLDFFEVEDDESGLYSAVHDALGGRGVSDFSAAVQDTALKELYALLSCLLDPLFAWARGLRSKSHNAAKAKAAAAPALAFYAELRRFMREEAAEEGLRGDTSPRGDSSPQGELPQKDEAAARAAAERFTASLAALEKLAARKPRPAKAGDQAPSRMAAAKRLISGELASEGARELAASYALLDGIKALCAASAADASSPKSSEGARRITERYGLDRKLREALGDSRGVAIAKALLPRLGTAAAGSQSRAALVAAASGDEELRSLIGVNVFNEVTWFNKELFEEAARRGALYAAIGPATGRPGLGALARSIRRAIRGAGTDEARCAIEFIAAAEKAGYRLDALAAGDEKEGRR
jgi:glycosidase